MTFRSLLVAAGVLGSISVASAQTPPEPPKAPPGDVAPPASPAPPAEQTPPVDPAAAAPTAAPGAPAAAPAAQAAPDGPGAQPAEPPPAPEPPPETKIPEPNAGAVASPAVRWSQTTGADTVLEEEEETQLRWRGSTFTWNQGGTTTIFGVGRDNIGSEGEFYGWDFTLRPNYYLLDRPKDKVTLNAEIGWVTELTNSDTTQYYREPQLKDMALGVRYGRELWQRGSAEGGDYRTEAAMRLRVLLPTSPTSWNAGRYFSLSVGPQVVQKVKLLGSKADGLNHVTATLGVTYAHLFAESYTPVNGDLRRTRRIATGETVIDDQLSGWSQDMDRLTTSLDIDLPLYKDLSLGTSFGLISRFKHKFTHGCDEDSGADCTEYRSVRNPDPTTYLANTVFDVNLSHPIYDVVNVTLGYNNTSPQLGEDGKRRVMFYSPEAQFYLDITANLDAIYSKVTGRGEKKDKPGTARAARQQNL
ncbi:hypothetical protein [Sorangium sp. So ce131]|uniref:hypothetical protein n=1 Tax=Sorangium sp. So ce131 TaxID=3133282 RepID=UPI003F62FE18